MSRWGTMLGLLAVALVAATSATAAPRDTTVRTIQDRDGDNLLEFAPGEDHCVFTPSLTSAPDCPRATFTRRKPESVLNFLHLSDFQIVDEESPARVEFLDTTQRAPGANPFSAAHRPQESLTPQITESMVRQARNTTSPITGERLDLTILTGDNADSQQHNETRWFIDILDGTTGPGNPDPEMDDRPGADRKVVPDSGRHDQTDACGPGYEDNDSVYDGVRNDGRVGQDTGYYEPDGEGDGDGYTPDRERNQAEVPGPHADVTVRDFPGLFERAQEPFEAVGLGMPWYSAFGNHDALVQGNSGEAFVGPFGNPSIAETPNPTYDAIARGCVKPSKLPPGTTLEQFLKDPSAVLTDPDSVAPMIVPPDDRRCFLAKDVPNFAAPPCATGGWIQQHSRTTGVPVGHGFEPFSVDGQTGEGRPLDARNGHDGYYAFRPAPGLRFLVLDTVTDDCGAPFCAEGSVDHHQYRWLESEIDAARKSGEYVMAFSHHTLRTSRMSSVDPSEWDPQTGQVHYGERFDRKERSQPPRPVRPDAPPDSTLEDLFCKYDNVLAHVTGHEHQNYVLQHNCEDPVAQQPGRHPFVEISTAAHIDWPQQSRMIELIRGDDGTLKLALTIVDHAAPPNPGGGNAGPQPLKLASIGREIAYNDYQGSRGARGDRSDRNVIVQTGKAWPPEPPPSP